MSKSATEHAQSSTASSSLSGHARRIGESKYRLGSIEIDRSRGIVSVAGEPIALRPKEHRLLLELCKHLGRAIPRERLLRRVWGPAYRGGMATVEIHVSRLRAKLGPELRLETVRRLGYRLRAPEGLREDAVPAAAAGSERF